MYKMNEMHHGRLSLEGMTKSYQMCFNQSGIVVGIALKIKHVGNSFIICICILGQHCNTCYR